MILSHQRFLPQDQEDELIDLMDGEKEWGELSGAEKSESAGGIYADEEIVTASSAAEGEEGGETETAEASPLDDIAGA